MAKIKMATVIKRDGKDTYTFRKGVAIVPGVRWCGAPMEVTLAEFMEALKECE